MKTKLTITMLIFCLAAKAQQSKMASDQPATVINKGNNTSALVARKLNDTTTISSMKIKYKPAAGNASLQKQPLPSEMPVRWPIMEAEKNKQTGLKQQFL